MEASLDRAAQLLNRRQIDMSLPPPPSSSSSSSSSSASPRPIRKTKSVAAAAEAAAAAAAWPTTLPPPPPPPGKRKRSPTQELPLGENTAAAKMAVTPGDVADNSHSRSFSSGPGPAPDDAAGHDKNSNNGDTAPLEQRAVDRDRRLARAAAFNNRAVLLIAVGRGQEACRLLRACLLLLPEEPRPVFNLALALWRLGRRRAACVHWLEARSWLGGVGEDGGGGGGEGRGAVDGFTKLLDAARRRKVGRGH